MPFLLLPTGWDLLKFREVEKKCRKELGQNRTG
jgi:hypothetical protein